MAREILVVLASLDIAVWIGAVWIGAVWIWSGVLAYGLLKNHYKRIYEKMKTIRHTGKEEAICVLWGLSGLLGLLVFLYLETTSQLIGGEKPNLGLCFRMPRELTRE